MKEEEGAGRRKGCGMMESESGLHLNRGRDGRWIMIPSGKCKIKKGGIVVGTRWQRVIHTQMIPRRQKPPSQCLHKARIADSIRSDHSSAHSLFNSIEGNLQMRHAWFFVI